MELSYKLYLLLILAVAVGRLIELRHSRKNQAQLRKAGSSKIPEPGYRWMVLFHGSLLLGAALESSVRPWLPWLGWPMLALFCAANAVRWWVIRTLGARWNVEIMSASKLGVIVEGPYRWVRHPNYSAVFVEMLALPLIHTAWLTALLGATLHVFILRRRVRLEESVLSQDPKWESTFANRPMFVPGLL